MMFFASLLLAYLAVANANQFWQQPLGEFFPGSWEPNLDPSSCTVSHTTAYEQSSGPIAFSTSGYDHLEAPRLNTINSTHWEQWEFDSTSETGLAGIMMGFSRDASYAFFGQGNLRVEFYIVLADGSVVQELDYVAESTIEDCPDMVRGVFKTTHKNRFYSFTVTRDMRHALLTFDAANVKGNFTITAAAPAHLPNGDLFPSTNKRSTQLSPKLYMSQPIPGGHTRTDATINGKRIAFNGVGGHVRMWAEDGWFNICDGWHFLRAVAGPYVISYWQPVSRVKGYIGESYYSAQLFKKGDKLVGTQRGTKPTKSKDKSEDYVLFQDEMGGEVSGGLPDKNTGHVIEFVSPSQGKTWVFSVQHMKKQFEMGLGGESGLSGFTNRVVGGEVGGAQYEGRALSEQVLLPKTIAQWRIWIVFGIGMFNRGKNFVLGVARRLF